MNDAALVRVLEAFGDLFRDWQRFIERDWALGDAIGECRALDQFHRERMHAAESSNP